MNLMHTARLSTPLDHEYAYSNSFLLGISILFCDFSWHVTCWLMSDIRRRPSRAPSAGHDVAGPDLHLELPDAQVRLAAWFRSGDVAPYTRPVEKHAAVGKLARRRAVRAHVAGHSPAGAAGPGCPARGPVVYIQRVRAQFARQEPSPTARERKCAHAPPKTHPMHMYFCTLAWQIHKGSHM